MPGQSSPQYYGAPADVNIMVEPKKVSWDPSSGTSRRRLTWSSVCLCLLAPWSMFMSIFGLLSFHIHYTHPYLCWFAVLMAAIFVGIVGLFALRATRKSQAETTRDPTYFVFLFWSCAVAWVLAVTLGLWNWSLLMPHYDVVTLNTYTNVDVGAISGTGVMDAGRFSFKAGSYIDTSKAYGFKKVDTYCVAPVASGKTPLVTYDFWAAGVNCCSGEPGDFHCGEANGKLQLGGGVRVLNNEEIPWLTLATQQAEAFHHLKVGHAIFFKNVADPLGAESTEMDLGVKFFCLWSFLSFGGLFMALVMMLTLTN